MEHLRRRRAALYCRCSTSDQKVDLQLDGLRSLAGQRKWTVVGEFVDHGISGTKTRRPQLDEMMRALHRGKVDVVAVWKLDRLGRSTRDLLNLLEQLRIENVELVSVQESLDTSTPTGRAMFTMVSMFAEIERDSLRERTRAGLAAARSRGVRLGRRPVEVDVERALQLRAQGLSVRNVAQTLGVPSTTLHRAIRSFQGGVPKTSPETAPCCTSEVPEMSG